MTEASTSGREAATYCTVEHSPELWVDVPVINVAALRNGSESEKRVVAAQIQAACGPRGLGFFYASNHGVDTAAHAAVTERFHKEMTPAAKHAIAVRNYNANNATQMRAGYYEAVPGRKVNESFCMLSPKFTADHPAITLKRELHEVNMWPDEGQFDWFRRAQEAHFQDLFDFSRTLLSGFALALGHEASYFDPYFSIDTTLSALSLIRYPLLDEYPAMRNAEDKTVLSFDDHYDVSLITVLYQSNFANLQVRDRDGAWGSIPANENAFLVNGGTFMQILSGGEFPTPLHRVKFVAAERLSIPFFVHLSGDAIVKPRCVSCSSASGVHLSQAPERYDAVMLDALHALIKKNDHT